MVEGTHLRAALRPLTRRAVPDLLRDERQKWRLEAKGSWTAISRAAGRHLPLPQRDCWHGGGLFTGQYTYWLKTDTDIPCFAIPAVHRDKVPTSSASAAGLQESTTLGCSRRLAACRRDSLSKEKDQDIFEKPIGRWILRKMYGLGAPWQGFY